MTVDTLCSSENLTKTMQQELERLASYWRWPQGDTPSPLSLARHGFAYSGEGFTVFCPMCHIRLDSLTRDVNPAEEHRIRSPGCPLANQLTSNSNPSEPIRPLSPGASNGALYNVYTSALGRYNGHNRQGEAAPYACLSLSVRVDRQNPDYELLRRERIRLDTFYDWPSSASATPEVLAREGLFYTGSIDRVRCAFCHNSLHSWVAGDSPTEEHRKHFPRCPFVLGLDVGNVRIDNDMGLGNSGQNLLPLTGAVTMGARAGQTSIELPSVAAFMSTPTVRAAMEMGFTGESVEQVVQQHLTETGKLFPSAESLVEQLLSLGISQSYVGAEAQMIAASASSATSAAAASSSVSLASHILASTLDAPLSSATVASPALMGASSSITSTAASASFGEERYEDMNIPQNEGAKKGNGPTKKRRRGPKREKTGAGVGSSSSSISSGEQLSAVLGETSSASIAAAANSPSDEIPRVVVDPEEQQLLDENSRLKEARTCKVCMDKEVNTVFLPCGHLICCDNCSPKVRNCPLCRTFIRGTVKTYLS